MANKKTLQYLADMELAKYKRALLELYSMINEPTSYMAIYRKSNEVEAQRQKWLQAAEEQKQNFFDNLITNREQAEKLYAPLNRKNGGRGI